MVIGIAGPTAGGKTTVAKMLEERYDAVRLRYSSILSEIAQARGLDPDDKATLQNLFLSERKTRGEHWLTKELEERVNNLKNEFVVIEGNRRLVDIETLRHIAKVRGESLLLLFIDALPTTRFARYNTRLEEQGEESITLEEFEKLEQNAAEDEISDLKNIFAKEGLLINTDNKNPEGVFEEVKRMVSKKDA